LQRPSPEFGEEESCDLVSTTAPFAVFVPIHKKLDKAKSIELIDRLLKYDIYMGSGIPASIKMIATIVMLYQVVSASPC